MSACFCVLNINFLAWQIILNCAAAGCSNEVWNMSSLFICQSLIMVFAHLVHIQLEPLLEFLCSLPGPTGKPALEFVMAEWMSRQHLFYGQYEGKVRWGFPILSPVCLKELYSLRWNNTVITLSTVLSPCVNSSSTVSIQTTSASKI